MHDDKIAPLHAMFSIDGEVSDDDTRFLKVTIDVMHTGENLNGSFFSKEVVDECIDSIKNTPILGYIKYDSYIGENDFEGHKYEIKRIENGVEKVYAGCAYGVIPESCNPRWSSKMCNDGVEREFLQVDALLWEKFPDATGILKRDSEKSESMEVDVSSFEGYTDKEDGLFHVTGFKFNGACILGDDVQPAMTGANIVVNGVDFSMDEFSKSIRSELNNKFSVFTKLVDKQNGQGGVGNMPEKVKDNDNIEVDFAQTVLQQFEDIASIVSAEDTVKDCWGYDTPRYYAVDIQDNEVIVVDLGDSYHYYGIAFTVDGDKPVLDFACKTRKKVRYENYEDGYTAPSGAFEFGEHISEINKKASDKVTDYEQKIAEITNDKESIETEYSQVKSELDEIKPKYDEYVAADKKRQLDELNAEKDAKIAEYEEVLGDSEDFSAIKDKKDEMTVDEIEKECAVLYVKASRSSKLNFSKNSSSAVVGIIENEDDDVDGYVNTKYGYIKKSY